MWSHHFMANRRGKSRSSDRFSLTGLQKSLQMVTVPVTLEDTCFLEGRPWQTLDSISKSKDITLLRKLCIVKAMVFPVVMYGCELGHEEDWVLKNWCFELWYWRRLLRVPWTTRRSNLSILEEINPEYSLEGLMLKLQYFGHLMRRTNSLEKTLMLVKIEGRRRRGQQRMRWLDGISDSMVMG